jgi:hypothetical protein
MHPQHVVHHGIPHRVDAVVVPVWDLVYLRAVAVPLELIQPELLVGERAPHRVNHDFSQSRQLLVAQPPHGALPGRPHPQLRLVPPHVLMFTKK